MTMDKENIQINKPMKRGRPKQKTTQFIIDENQEAKKLQKEKREPFRPIDNDQYRKKSNVLQTLPMNQMHEHREYDFGPTGANRLTFHEHMKLQAQNVA